MLLVMQALGRDYFVWDKAGEIEFVKPGRGAVVADFHLTDEVLTQLRTATAGGAKHLHWFDVDVTDAQGEVVARVRKQLYVRLKPAARGQAAADATGSTNPAPGNN